MIWFKAEIIEVNGSPEMMSSTLVKGCVGSKLGGGVSDLSPETGKGM